jgi:hypothetical protein
MTASTHTLLIYVSRRKNILSPSVNKDLNSKFHWLLGLNNLLLAGSIPE